MLILENAAFHSADRAMVDGQNRPFRIFDMFRAKYGPRNVERYYPKHDVALEVPLG
jgi:hypothetical protein